MKTRRLPSSVRPYGAVLLPLKVALLLAGLYDLEFIGNIFRKSDNVVPCELKNFLYFTNISLIYTACCFACGMFRGISRLCDFVYAYGTVTALVLEIIVFAMFWILYIINPKYVKQTPPAPGTPLLDIFLTEAPKHIFPVFVLCLEFSSVPACGRWNHRAFFVTFCSLYYLVNETYATLKKAYIYPFLAYLSWQLRLLLFAFLTICSIAIYEVLTYKRSVDKCR